MTNFLHLYKAMPWQICASLQNLERITQNAAAQNAIVSRELLMLGRIIDDFSKSQSAVAHHHDINRDQKEEKMGILKDLLEQALAHLKSNPEAEIVEKIVEDVVINEAETLLKDVEAKIEPASAPSEPAAQ
jgi:lipopolysaccharide biosynthesis regulator YciM